jgi:hypothetical protein
MGDGMSFDLTGLSELTADLGRAPVDAGPQIRKAIVVSSAKIKKAWQDKLSGTPGVPFGPKTITYDVGSNVSIWRDATAKVQGGANQIVSEIGAEDGREQAPIVAVLEYGSPVNNLPPHGYGTAALQENQEDFVNGLLLAIGDPLGESTELANPIRTKYPLPGGES